MCEAKKRGKKCKRLHLVAEVEQHNLEEFIDAVHCKVCSKGKQCGMPITQFARPLLFYFPGMSKEQSFCTLRYSLECVVKCQGVRYADGAQQHGLCDDTRLLVQHSSAEAAGPSSDLSSVEPSSVSHTEHARSK
ncbi:MAG: hypothetical protein ACTJLM_05460 [Ehrlichia sp.]